jgi:hypothetical protein
MKAFAGLLLLALCLPAVAQERRVEVDPNTKIEGGADVRGSGANAGAGAQPDNRSESKTGNVAGPDRPDAEKDKPISERKPQEREREEAAKGGSVPQR